MKKNILILSDLHIGKSSRFAGLKIENGDGAAEIKEIKKLFDKQKIKIDLIIIPGDITDACDPDLIKTANNFLIGLTEILGLSTDRLICIPGNHDSNWNVMSQDKAGEQLFEKRELEKLESKYWFGQRYSPWQQPGIEIFSNKKVGSLIEKPYCDLIVADNIAVALINTAAYDGPEKPHHGYISEHTFSQLSEMLNRDEICHASYRVAVFHHHPLLYEDPTGYDKDFSAIPNAEKLLNILSENAFDFIVHGHKHIPKFHSLYTDLRPGIHVLSAGSFGYLLPSVYNGLVSNTMHVIQIDGRDSEDNLSNGVLRNWSYIMGSGWVPSKDTNGLTHYVPFGPYFSEKKLTTLLEIALTESFSNRDWVEWKLIISLADYKKLAYIRYDKVIIVLTALQNSMNLTWRGEDVERLIILKN